MRTGREYWRRIATRADLPPPSYLLHSSRHRVHVFWRVTGFDIPRVEALQKQLARELKTDTAATSCSQLTRLPGLFNHKRQPAELVTMVYGRVDRVYEPGDFPAPKMRVEPTSASVEHNVPTRMATRARTPLPRRASSRDCRRAMVICTRSGFVVALCAASHSTMARPSNCCRSGTRAACRRGPIASWNRRSRARGTTVVNRSAGCWRHGNDASPDFKHSQTFHC